MLYLTTGGNGAGKTLFTLKAVRELQLKENRPVCYNGRFDIVPNGELANWKKIDIQDWQAEPDGTIFFVDECHNDFPNRPASGAVPEYVKMLAEHRKRGFDFFLITQHPQNIDSFVRRLIQAPGWHRHLKRTFGADLVSELMWPAVNPQCEKNGSGKSGQVTMKAFPKEVYNWYTSASLHTGKKKIPRQVWYVAAAVIAVPVMFWQGIKLANPAARAAPEATDKVAPVYGSSSSQNAPVRVKTAAEYVADFRPRVGGLPHTAPRYDEITRPARAPVPAACVSMKSKGCKCFTQQGTALPAVPIDLCESIVKEGFFLDFEANGQAAMVAQQPVQIAPQASKPVEAAPSIMEVPIERPQRAYTVADLVAEHRERR